MYQNICTLYFSIHCGHIYNFFIYGGELYASGYKYILCLKYIMSYDIEINKCAYRINTKKQYKIMIVDDDVDIANMLQTILGSRGHNVTVVTDCISCLNKCQLSNYDVIFMDFYMENIDGVDLIKIINDACNSNPIVFAFTGDDSKNILSMFKNAGAYGAIIKPIDINSINKLMNFLESKNETKKESIIVNKNAHSKNLHIFDKMLFEHI